MLWKCSHRIWCSMSRRLVLLISLSLTWAARSRLKSYYKWSQTLLLCQCSSKRMNLFVIVMTFSIKYSGRRAFHLCTHRLCSFCREESPWRSVLLTVFLIPFVSLNTVLNKGQCVTKYYRWMQKNGGYIWIQSCATIAINTKNANEKNIIWVNYLLR